MLLQALPAWSQCNCNDANGDGFPEANATCTGTSITFPKERWEDAQGQDVTFDFSCGGGPCACGQYVTGDYWVIDPDDGSADLTFTSVSPAPVLVPNHGWQHGWTVNPNPISTYGDIGCLGPAPLLLEPWDGDDILGCAPFSLAMWPNGTANSYDPPSTGHPLVLMKGVSRPPENYAGEFTLIQKIVRLTILKTLPTDPMNLFPPPYFEQGPLKYPVLANLRWSDVNTGKLGKLDCSDPSLSGKPPFHQASGRQGISDRFKYPQVDWIGHFAQRRYIPVANTTPYAGVYFTEYDAFRDQANSEAALRFLCDDFDAANPTHKGALARYLQYAIDQTQLVLSGWTPFEHGRGRVIQVLLASVLTDVLIFEDTISQLIDNPFHTINSFQYRGSDGIAKWVERGGQLCSEEEYWSAFNTSDLACADPYGKWDATGSSSGESYLLDANSGPAVYASLLAELFGVCGTTWPGPVCDFGFRWMCGGPGGPNCAPCTRCPGPPGHPGGYLYPPSSCSPPETTGDDPPACEQTGTCVCGNGGTPRSLSHAGMPDGYGAHNLGFNSGSPVASAFWQRFQGHGPIGAPDNCTTLHGAQPACDSDGDGYGNACDGDFSNDGFVLADDFLVWIEDFQLSGLDRGVGTDMNCDGYVLGSDFTEYWVPQFAGPGQPGPSNLSCAGTVPCDAE